MKSYDYQAIEKKWSKIWEETGLYRTDVRSDKTPLYLLIEFPYPSGAGLHVGHGRSYTALDIIARKKRSEGYEVLFPIGWDAFGLPAENYAIKTGIHPSITTRENITTFRRQLKECGFSFDWEREVDTTDPAYYKWTQWIFLKMYEKGLAYKKMMPVNWCPKDKCVLANEEVIEGKCERCGTEVTKKNKEQWMLAITKYAERLDKDLDETTYLEKIKIQQRNWIGLSSGSEIDFTLIAKDFNKPFTIFTTRADTIFGATYCVLAPDHSLVTELLDSGKITNSVEVIAYRNEAIAKLDIERNAEGKEKTGVALRGVMAINPANKEEIPVFIADYVLSSYGTGAIMAVPAHDERDYEFAKKFGVAIKDVIAKRYVFEGDDKERSDVETIIRNVVDPIIHDGKGNFYLIKDKEKECIHFAGGGLEEGESNEAALSREITEETGFTDFEIIKKIAPSIMCIGYHHRKKVNSRSVGPAYEVIVRSDTKIQCEVDEGKHDLVKVKKDEVLATLTWPHHKFLFEQYLANVTIYTNEGVLINGGKYDGMTSAEAKKKITEDLGGRVVTKSKLRDWVFARQRYWGEPIPLVYDKEGNMYPVHESELPVVLPMVEKYEPTDNGESPLAIIDSWVNVTGELDEFGYFHSSPTGRMFRRETDTMPQWAGSSWYFMRYIDPHNTTAIGDTELLKKWLPVNWYNGGMEHTTLHLLYSRFWYKFLHDIGIVPTSEPYAKRTSHGMILGAGGVKMSKSLGNVINPDDIIKSNGADVLRVYEMFIGPFDQQAAWDDKAIAGVARFLDRVYALRLKIDDTAQSQAVTHKTIKQVSQEIDSMAFNTCISALMIAANEYEKSGVTSNDYKIFIKLLSSFAPFVTEEIWQSLGEKESVHSAIWPVFDERYLIKSEANISLQVNGKLRGVVTAPFDADEEKVMSILKSTDLYGKYVGSGQIRRVVFVKNKIVNIVI